MDTPIAAVIAGNPASEMTGRLSALLEFFGVPAQIFENLSDLQHAVVAGSLRGRRYSIIGSITQLAALLEGGEELGQEISGRAESLFCYLDPDISRCSQLLQKLLRYPKATLVPLQGTRGEVEVSKCCPDVTGSMHGVQVIVRPGSSDYGLAADGSVPFSKIVGTKDYPSFFETEYLGIRTFVNCSAELPDLKSPLQGRYYDIKEDFLSAVPIVAYLKWAFRSSGWRNSEPGACLIIDDPILKTKYGFCDFRQIDAQMRELGFSTNISVIPWNWRRTSDAAAALVRGSEGRFSISIHGCDHTGSEFATSALPTLNRKVTLAKQRMERHRKRSAVSHDQIMVFPQGAFSRESLAVLQQHQFLAAVNTEVLPSNGARETASIGNVWSVAIVEHGSFPVFTRRYPSHGIENFAFDLLLGKPCLIVEHHQFFKENGREALSFISALNSLNCRLQWGSLGQVLRRAYQWRAGPNGEIQIRMFANELLLRNESQDGQCYQIQKANEDSAGIEKILVDGCPVEGETDNASITFSCTIPPNTQILIQIQYRSSLGPVTEGDSFQSMTKTALRRFLCEFRDTFLSRHARLFSLAQKTRSYAARR